MSTLKVTNIESPSGGGISAKINDIGGGQLSNRNLIINGAMVVSQRGNPSTGSDVYAADRFRVFNDASASSFTVSNSSDAPVGFQNSAKVVVSSAVTPGGGAGVVLRYQVEGYDAAQLDLGTGAAKTFTLSFWVKSTLTGTFAGVFANGAFDRYYIYEYTINAANTWEHKTVTIAGDTTGTWEKTNGDGMRIYWDLGSGSGLEQTKGSWNAGSGLRTADSINFCQNAGAEFYLTGVQLEVGDTATSFEHRSYSDELLKCYRYYELWPRVDSYYQSPGAGYNNLYRARLDFKVPKRATPDVTTYGTGGYPNNSGTVDTDGVGNDSVVYNTISIYGFSIRDTASPHSFQCGMSADAEL